MTTRVPRGDWSIQTLIFDKDFFTRSQAIRWAEEHDFKAGKVHETENSYRLRQEPVGKITPGTFRTMVMTEGVKAVGGRLLRSNPDGPWMPPFDKRFEKDAAGMAEIFDNSPDDEHLFLTMRSGRSREVIDVVWAPGGDITFTFGHRREKVTVRPDDVLVGRVEKEEPYVPPRRR